MIRYRTVSTRNFVAFRKRIPEGNPVAGLAADSRVGSKNFSEIRRSKQSRPSPDRLELRPSVRERVPTILQEVRTSRRTPAIELRRANADELEPLGGFRPRLLPGGGGRAAYVRQIYRDNFRGRLDFSRKVASVFFCALLWHY